MIEAYEESKEELKRVDHLIYVSLKYTRTVDVLRNVLNRLLSSLDFSLTALLKKAVHEHSLPDIPDSFREKCDEARRVYAGSDQIVELISIYIFLKKLEKSDYKREQEYRRHVAMIAVVDGKEFRLDIDSVTERYKRIREIIESLEPIITGKSKG
jgi:hypothetical protein